MKEKGFTLLETMIYLALFALIIGGGLLAVFQILQGSGSNENQILVLEEANFLMHKIDSALTGASNITVSENSFSVVKDSALLKFSAVDKNLNIKRNAEPEIIINSSRMAISNVSMEKLEGSSSQPDGIRIGFTITSRQGGRNFSQNVSTIKYLRQ
jgi:type II secretory pathway component PulJ